LAGNSLREDESQALSLPRYSLVQTIINDLISLRTKPKAIAFVVVLTVFFLFPTLVDNDYYTRVGISLIVFTVLCASFRMMVQVGEFNMALPAFMAIGAYCTALLTTKHDLNWWIAMPTAGVLAAATALVLGRVVLRVKGIYFAILAFGIVMMIRFVWLAWPDIFGGASGIANIPTIPGISGSIDSFFYFGLCIALIALAVYYRLEKSRYGLILHAIGQSDALVEAAGINVMRYKTEIFVITAFFAGILGAYFASMQHFIDPEEFGFNLSLLVVVYTVIGGLLSFWGPVVGTANLIIMPIYIREVIIEFDPKIEPIIMGIGMALIMITLPRGVIFLPRTEQRRWRRNYNVAIRPALVFLHLKRPRTEPWKETKYDYTFRQW